MKLSLIVLSIIFLFASCAGPTLRRQMKTEQAIEEAYRKGDISKKEYLDLRIRMEQSIRAASD
jgi:hypothetical protein